VADDHSLWHGASAVAHPGYLIRKANSILALNVLLGPWIHVESNVRHFSAVHSGTQLSTRARVVELFERKGHRFVTLDVALFAQGAHPVLRARHVAIYDIRPAAPS
jgi:acyl dehydratase